MSNNHQVSSAKVICKGTLPISITELNHEMNELIKKGYEPIKISGFAEENISRICVLMIER